MKTFYLFCFSILLAFSALSQTVHIPDQEFKNELISTSVVYDNFAAIGDVDTNDDGEIQVSEAEAVTEIHLFNYLVTDYTGLEAFVNLEVIRFIYGNGNSSMPLDFNFDFLTNLTVFDAYLFPFQDFNFSSHPNLETFSVYGTYQPLTFDFSSNPLLREFIIGPGGVGGSIPELDFSNNPNLTDLDLHNSHVDYINLKNGSVTTYFNVFSFDYMCVDINTSEEQLSTFRGAGVVNSYCSFYPEGDYSSITGTAFIDSDSNGCDVNDPTYPNLTFFITDGATTGMSSANSNGDYFMPLADGVFTITPNVDVTTWNVSPSSVTLDLTQQLSSVQQNFCLTPNGSIEDLEVVVVPLEEARPGFETDYAVQIKNKGNQTTSGSLSLLFQEEYMTYEASNPLASRVNNELNWSFSNLEPFQSERFTFSMTMNVPNGTTFPLVGGEVLDFTAIVTGNGTDAMPADNTMSLLQTVVNSYDPNDKTCLEGKQISEFQVGEYVHYLIRFENLGTASAVNIVVKDEIDTTKFDMSTFVPLGGSHDYYVRTVGDGNTVEFIHENIYLDFNDATNDGFVLFKIKTLPSLVDGDTFSNDAEIYFDFNAPIVTNNETTTVYNILSNQEVEDRTIKLYPNPSSGLVNLSASSDIKSVSIMDVQGRTLSTTDFISSNLTQQLDLSQQRNGIYFLKVTTIAGVSTQKVVVE